ncbi:MAG: diguanylate cyclase [Gammaproteobacteria bacterium]|nr:diguanylate cyclase [Gammaproteobacteria bacterium]
MRAPLPRSALCRPAAVLVACALLAGLASAGQEPARTEGSAPARARALAAAVDQGSIDPQRGRAELRRLRQQAVREGDRALRWLTDAAECRLLADIDVDAAATVARDGLRARPPEAGAPPQLRTAWLNLRVCAAGIMLQQGRTAAGLQELTAVLAATQAAGFAGVHAVAMMERGDERSRRGDFVRAQADLLTACDTLARLQWGAEARNCMERVAAHYGRIGEFDVALKYYRELLATARARGAHHDQGIVLYNIARLYMHRADPAVALDWFRQARTIELAKRDTLGIAYNDAGIGEALLELGRPLAALPHLRHAEPVFTRFGDSQVLRTRVAIAAALTRTGQAVEALTLLNRTEPEVRTHDDELLLARLLDARAAAQAGMGQWQNAYQSLRAQNIVSGRLNDQRQSEQAARLRQQFNSEQDATALTALAQAAARERALQRTQQVALVLALALLCATSLYAWNKWKQARHLRALALVDDLTRIANRRAILALGEDLLRQARLTTSEFSVLVIDIDHFKTINDQLGHAAGDRVLRHVALLIGAALRPRDALGRLGGEEFLVLLPATSGDAAVVLAERVRETLAAAPLAAHTQPVRLTISVGVATAARADTLTRLLERADRALYRAKSDGRNRICVADDGGSGWWTALRLERAALPRDPESETSSHERADHRRNARSA